MIGFYGKLPSHGDFLRRRVSDAFVGVWDAWLQECVTASRLALGDRWLDVYLTSPAWRFGCAAGACGPLPVIGVMVPSVDRVGRYFPLTLVAELPPTANLLAIASRTESFFDNAERLVIDTLAADRVDFERFDESVLALGQELTTPAMPSGMSLDPAVSEILTRIGEGVASWQMPIMSCSQLGPAFEQLLSHRLSSLYDPLVLWWTQGSSIVEPSCLIVKGLPHPDTFTSLLDGSWAGRRWRSVTAKVETPAHKTDALVEHGRPPRYRSAGATDIGRIRGINQDAFVERPEVGVWAVADGLGGHSDGEVASRMVCDALADVLPGSSFDDTIDTVCQRISDVNTHLVRAAGRASEEVRSGSTVVTFLARDTRCAVLWAGDSRAYRWRSGRLEQLTRDHSLVDPEGLIGGEDSHAITRAVGGEATLSLDVLRDGVRVGDRFLLCSDGLTRAVPDAHIRSWMEHQDIRTAVDGLIRATLDAGAPDNVTVLIVEACE
jgi:type VI secretion system protein ImpM